MNIYISLHFRHHTILSGVGVGLGWVGLGEGGASEGGGREELPLFCLKSRNLKKRYSETRNNLPFDIPNVGPSINDAMPEGGGGAFGSA